MALFKRGMLYAKEAMYAELSYLSVEQAEGDSDLQGQAPQLMQAREQVHDAVSVHRHESLDGPTGVRGHVHTAHQQCLVVDQACQCRA